MAFTMNRSGLLAVLGLLLALNLIVGVAAQAIGKYRAGALGH